MKYEQDEMCNKGVLGFINRKLSYLNLATLKDRLRVFVPFWPLAYAAILLAATYVSHFAILSNDTFPLRWQADHLSLEHPESFYNGFFPIGYPLLLRAAAFSGNPLFAMMLVQIALSPLYAFLAYKLIREFASERATILALPFVLFSPQVVRTILSPTPDFLASLAVLAGFVAIARARGMKSVLIAGIGVGIGCIFRSHVLALAAGFTITFLLIEIRNLKMLAYFWAGFLPFVIAQGLVQVWSGHVFLENAQAFNVWRGMYGMDWNNPPTLDHPSALRIIMQNPSLFLKWYYVRLLDISPFIIIPITIPIVAALDLRGSRSLILLSLATSFYFLITTSGGSPRELTLAIPPVATAAIYLVEMAFGRFLQLRWVAPTVASIAVAIALTGLFYYLSGSGKRVEDYAEVERLLNVKSNTDANMIYADDFDLYFPGLKYLTPRQSGGWPGIGIPHYASEFPHVRDTSAAVEHADLTRDGVRWAVFRIPPYDGRGYASVRSDSSLFKLIYRTRLHEIFHIQ